MFYLQDLILFFFCVFNNYVLKEHIALDRMSWSLKSVWNRLL